MKTLELPEQEETRPQTPPSVLPTKQPSSYRLVIQNGNVVDVVKVRESEKDIEVVRDNILLFLGILSVQASLQAQMDKVSH